MRNHNLDVIRGIAVMGLMFMNSYYFGVFEYGYLPLTDKPLSDSVIQTVNLIFIDGRFRSLFCLLFGASLAIQWQYWQKQVKIVKRLQVLALFGLVHGFLIWAGDILFIYACAGWLVVRFLNTSDDILLKRSWQCLLLGGSITFILAMFEPSISITRDSEQFARAYDAWYESLLSMIVNNARMFLIMLLALPLVTVWMAAGLMLLGVYCYRRGVFVNGLTPNTLLVVVFLALIFSALRLVLELHASHVNDALQEPVNWLAALFTALVYVHILVKLVDNQPAVLQLLQTAGRTALTLYVSQSVLLVIIFKLLFPHWIIDFDRLDYWLLVSFLVCLLLVFCHFYKQHFKQGPLEWAWRMLCKR
ncbi:DUF418 domain-containing protein [Pseudoalteromonas mariniglutinosa]|uniref:DUF418 domain-containing protein n=1 Tax=Pseudoalteromonas mariniglutinosa TaxID=206042 RepID=UPI0038507023